MIDFEKYLIAEEGILGKFASGLSSAYKKYEEADRKKHPERYAKFDKIREDEERKSKENSEAARKRAEEELYKTRYRWDEKALQQAFKEANLSMKYPDKFKNSDLFEDNEFWEYIIADVKVAVKKFINTKAFTNEVKRICDYHNSHKSGDIPYDETLPKKVTVNWWKSKLNNVFDEGDYYICISPDQYFTIRYGYEIVYMIGEYVKEKYKCYVDYGDGDEGCIYFD